MSDPAAVRRWVGAGITTFSSRLYGSEVEGYINLERRGLELMRLGYSAGWLMDNPNWKAFIQRIGDTVGLGGDLIWNIGLSITSVDGTLGDNCVSIEKKLLLVKKTSKNGLDIAPMSEPRNSSSMY